MNLELASSADLHQSLKTASGSEREAILHELQKRYDETVPLPTERLIFRDSRGRERYEDKPTVRRYDFTLLHA